MIPLRHTIPRHAPPLVTRGLVAANVVVFIAQLLMGPATERIIQTFGFIPVRLYDPAQFQFALWEVCVTLVTSLFLHGGFVHLFGNMIYLWVFGGPVEDMLGHWRYAAFFVICGVMGSLTHAMLYSDSTIPSIGASGSIAGVLGAFLVMRPRARIVTLLPLVVYWALIEVRAALFLPIWFGMQFFNGFLSLSSAQGTEQVAGVAWWAHVGGFLIGAGVALAHRVSRSRRWRRVA
jgi:hypothetical protein